MIGIEIRFLLGEYNILVQFLKSMNVRTSLNLKI